MPANYLIQKLPYPAEMRQWDKMSIEFGIPEIVLMENASQAIFRFIRDDLKRELKGRRCLALMGNGANGGDAVCIARHLKDAGAAPLIGHFCELNSCKGILATQIELAQKDNVPFIRLSPESLLEDLIAIGVESPVEFMLDGLLGTGFHGILRKDMAQAIGNINKFARFSRCPIYAIDIPSGLNGSDGKPAPIAIEAAFTITLGAPKPGVIMPTGRRWTGPVYCRDIGFPSSLYDKFPATWELLDGHSLEVSGKLPANSFKNLFGHVLVIGGAQGWTGAAHLAAAAALKTGAGLVTVCASASGLPEIKDGLPEIMTLAVSETTGWPDHLDNRFKEKLDKCNAMILGPGMGRSKDALEFLRLVLSLPERPPALLDADALILLAQDESLAGRLTSADIITPHPGEAGVLLGISGADVQLDRRKALDSLCAKFRAAVVLKGACSLIGLTTSLRLLCPYDIPQLAIGGAGDVLSGIIGALMAMPKISSLHPAAHGVILHAMAGLKLALKFQERGILASDIVNEIPLVDSFLQSLKKNEAIKGQIPWPLFY